MFKVIGIEKIVQPETAMQDISGHWETYHQIMDSVPGESTYVVYDKYEGNFMKPYRYHIGKKVPLDYELTDDDKKVGLTLNEIPEAKYEVVTALGNMPLALVDKWKMIWAEKEDKRTYTTDFEIHKSENLVEIHLAVK